ncbi:22385_t:CDS:2 [Cetraspora pellucida]|uniref:22385_t:CDS:1 n=1 Tax=Cetraspora pellucida TaxID=1433469 RepID=A0A9N9J1S3_9GLOM|nr:22385_t:CDS:2 [Cetraspora pellucida]
MTTLFSVILSAAQKHDICQAKKINSNIKNIDLASKYQVEKSTITDILKEKELQLKRKKALELWIDNAFNSSQDIDGHILKNKAKFFADHFLIDDFYYSDSWLTSFKKCHRLCQFKKESESASAPPIEQIENDQLAL